jgi:ADP-sugar diphosphatase
VALPLFSSKEIKMASITINNVSVPVECVPGLDLERALKSPLLLNWASTVQPDIKVEKVIVSSIDYFGPRVGFLKIEAVAFYHGVKIPGICFLRGGAVSILVLLECEGQTYLILTRQPRVPVGSSGLLELPAGMLDGSGAFAGVAAKELAEETGIQLKADDLIDLTELTNKVQGANLWKGMLPSAGGCDEFLRLLFHKRSVTRPELDAMRGKATGLLEEGEVIVLDIVLYEDAWKVCRDAKLLSSMLLYERLRAAGLL